MKRCILIIDEFSALERAELLEAITGIGLKDLVVVSTSSKEPATEKAYEDPKIPVEALEALLKPIDISMASRRVPPTDRTQLITSKPWLRRRKEKW